MKLVIDRARWLRGDSNSFLQRVSDGKQCCLGFYAKALGHTNDEIKGVTTPRNVTYFAKKQRFPDWCLMPPSQNKESETDLSCLMSLNDNESWSDADREQAITEIFAKHGVEVEFVG